MNQTNNGKTELDQYYNYEPIEELITKRDNYLLSEGVVVNEKNEEAEETLKLGYEKILLLSPKECLAKAYVLFSYCNHLQLIYNKHKIRLDWCDDVLNRTVSRQADQFDKYTKWEQKYHLVIAQDAFAEKVWNVRRLANSRVVWFDNLIRDTRRMADTLLELGKKL